MCVLKHSYHHSELDLKYHDIGNGWTFVSSSLWKNSVNTTIRDVGLLLSPCALKSLSCIKRTQLRIMYVTFNGNLCTMIVACYNPPMQEMNQISQPSITGYLSSFAQNILIIGGDMNAQIGQNENDKFSLYNLPNRNGKYLADIFSFYSRTVFYA